MKHLKKLRSEERFNQRKLDSPVGEALYRTQNAKIQREMRKDKEQFIEQ